MDKNYLLTRIAEQLDIPPSMHRLATKRYSDVANYLVSKDIPADIYPQGSFRLGTVVRPVKNGVESDYDIDLVCQINYEKRSTTPKELKTSVGNLLKENETYKKILDEEGRRCWTLNYAETNGFGFHLDILPSIPEDKNEVSKLTQQHSVPAEYANSAIAATNKDKETKVYTWTPGNPDGYADWFNRINAPFYSLVDLKKSKNLLFENNRMIFASVEDVPDHFVKTQLQRVIQILKRHRDVRLASTKFEEDAPISIIITTLCAEIVDSTGTLTADLSKLLSFVVDQLFTYSKLIDSGQIPFQKSNGIIRRNPATKEWIISNPVNPKENFADKWHEENNKKAIAFFTWVQWLKEDLGGEGVYELSAVKRGFGEKLIEGIIEKFEKETKPSISVITPKPININISNPSKPYGE